MKHHRMWRSVLGVLVALTVWPAGLTSAATPTDERRCVYPMCGGFASFPGGSVRGAVLAELRADDKVRVSWIGKWEGPDFDAVRIVGSGKPCTSAFTSASRVFAGRFGDGSFEALLLPLLRPLPRLASVRLFDPGTGGAQLACAPAFVYEELAAGSPGIDGALARLERSSVQGLVIERTTVEDDTARLTLALQGLEPSTGYTLFGTDAACGSQHHQSDLDFIFGFTTDAAGGEVAIETIEIAHEGASFRLVKGAVTGGPLVACAATRLFDWHDDF